MDSFPSPPIGRKPTKTVGLDNNSSRREREEKYFKWQKNRRGMRASLLRKLDSSQETSTQTPRSKLCTEGIREMVSLLHTDDSDSIVKAASYFQSILSIVNCPHVDTVVESGVVPRLVELLDCGIEDVQFKIAWAVTNIACGEPHHIHCLVKHGALQRLTALLGHASNLLREQCLWAIGNLSGHSEITRDLLLSCGLVDHLLATLCIGSQTNIQPSLLSMQQIARICSNIVRDAPLPHDSVLESVIIIVAELLQSPDESVLVSLCYALSTVCKCRDQLLPFVLEKGVMVRLHDLCSITAVRWAAVSVFCAIVKSEEPLYRTIVLRKKYGAIAALLMELGDSTVGKSSEEWLEIAVKVDICTALSTMLSKSLDESECDELVHKRLHTLLVRTMQCNHFEVTSAAGLCLCKLLVKSSPGSTLDVACEVYPAVISNLLRTLDMNLLYAVLSSTLRVFDVYSKIGDSVPSRISSAMKNTAHDENFVDMIEQLILCGYNQETRDMAQAILSFCSFINPNM
mmetsp:Transcript_21021/g.30353  ORF Transcript_21021/g.30353 Transcript_21021/m.30353 type:complete len:515 (+) Transcript_21021:42-1586(+)